MQKGLDEVMILKLIGHEMFKVFLHIFTMSALNLRSPLHLLFALPRKDPKSSMYTFDVSKIMSSYAGLLLASCFDCHCKTVVQVVEPSTYTWGNNHYFDEWKMNYNSLLSVCSEPIRATRMGKNYDSCHELLGPPVSVKAMPSSH